jgi:CubicO group peptidase (beta-lactamase class C family)
MAVLSRLLLLLIAGVLVVETPSQSLAAEVPALPSVKPSEAGFDEAVLQPIDEIVARGIAEHKMPGCVIAFGTSKQLAWLKAYGNQRVEFEGEPAVAMTSATVFDLASLTKPIATGTSIMLLVQDGKLKIDEPVATYLPAFVQTGDEQADAAKQQVTVRQLLIHTSGQIADNSIRDYEQGVAEAEKRLLALKLRTPPGENFTYSDVNFITLGLIIRQLSGQNVHEFSQARIFQTLGMKDTTYIPAPALRERAAPTERRNGAWMQGEVHDPRAYKLEGIAGHAGLFSTAQDLSKYAAAMLQRGTYQSVKIMEPATWQEMTKGNRISGRRNNGEAYQGLRGLSWDMQSGFSTNGGTARSDAAFGHGGFTGTVIWMDPEQDWFFIFLSNRVHPNGKGSVNPLAGEIATLVAKARKR